MSVHHTKMSHSLYSHGNKGVLLLSLLEIVYAHWHIFLASDYRYTFHPLNDVFRYNSIFAITIFRRVTKDIVIAKLDCTLFLHIGLSAITATQTRGNF